MVALMLMSLSWQAAQAQIVITMEDVPGRAAPTVFPHADDHDATHTLIQAQDIRLSTTAAGMTIEIPQNLSIETTEILDITGRHLAQAQGTYQRATLRSSQHQIAIIRWHTNQGLIVRKVRL